MSLATNRLLEKQANHVYKCWSHHSKKDKCPKCGSAPQTHFVKNYAPVWRDAQVFCKCGAYVRTWDVPKVTRRKNVRS